jgi:hypothetical protein
VSEKMILMPEMLTAENGAKYALIGEFYETIPTQCHECHGNPDEREDCEFCEGTGEITQRVPVQWTTIKDIYKRAVALLGQPQDEVITQAIAAERERCAKAISILIEEEKQTYGEECPDILWAFRKAHREIRYLGDAP